MLLFFLWIPTLAWGIPSRPSIVVSFPLQSQYPLIARAGSAYRWCFSPNTFDTLHENAGSLDITYSVNHLPHWAHFDPDTRCFVGNVPKSAALTSNTITVVASSEAYNASSDEFELVTTTAPEPLLNIPFSRQLVASNTAISSAFVVNPSSALAPFNSTLTALGGKAGLRVPPSWSFSIGLLGSTFTSDPPFYLASLSDGAPLPSWIHYDQDTFTFDGIAPRRNEAIEIKLAATDIEGYSTNAADTFWLTIAAHELKLKDAARGLSRNVTSAATEFVLQLLNDNEGDPFEGELLWDSVPLPRAGVRKIVLDTGDTSLSFDAGTTTLSGHIPSGTAGPLLSFPLRITDSQNMTARTFLHLQPVPSVFTTSSHNGTVDLSVSVVNASSLKVSVADIGALQFNLAPFIDADALASIRRGEIDFEFSTKPTSIKTRYIFDSESLSLRPAIGMTESSVRAHSSGQEPTTSATTAIFAKDRQHTFPLGRIQTSRFPNQHPLPKPEDSFNLDGSANPSVDVTFYAYSKVARVTSKLIVTFQMDAPPVCPTSLPLDSSNNAATQERQNDSMKQIAIICGTIFGSLLMLVLLWVYYRFHKKRVEALATNEMSSTGGIVKAHANSTLEDDIFFWKSHPDPRKKRRFDTNWSSEKQSTRRVDSSSYTTQKVFHPSTEVIFAASPSGEQIEEEAPPHLEASSYGPTERIPTSSYQEVSKVHSQVPTDMNVHLSFDAPILISTVGTTISKYNFFAKQRGHNPSAVQGTKSAVIEEKTPTAPTALQKKIYSDVCKSSSNSLSKLQYKTPGETSTRPHNPRTPECDKSSLKESISRPEPIRSSLEERLMKEYSGHVPNPAEVNVRSSPQADIRADVASIAGTVIIHSMERWSRNLSRQPTLGMTESRSISSPPNQPSIMHDPEWGFDSHESVWEDIDQMLRKRSEDAGLPSESSSLAYFSPSSRIDAVPNAHAVTRLDSSSIITRPEPEVPRRRVDFDNKRGVCEQRRISRITEADEDDIHSSLKSQNNQSSIPSEESTESVAVVSKAAIAIRSLPSDIRLIPAPTSMAREGNQSYPQDAIASDMTTSASTQVRLVQFMNHRSYQGRDSTGNRTEAPPSEALHEYHGKREMSHKAVVDGPYGVTAIEGGLYSSSVTARPSTNVPIIEEIPGSGRVDKIKSLREQSEKLRERQKLLQADPQYHQGLNMMSSSEEELLSDPAVVLGIQYMRAVDTSSDGDSTNLHIYESGQDETEIDLRPRPSSYMPSFLPYGAPNPTTHRHSPPRIPLPPTPKVAPYYYDISDTTSDSSSSEIGSSIILPPEPVERILVGVNEPFNFAAPIHLPGDEHVPSSRSGQLRTINNTLLSPSSGARIRAELEDGRQLPDWLGFDAREMEFWGVPELVKGRNSLRVRVVMNTGASEDEISHFIIEVVGR